MNVKNTMDKILAPYLSLSYNNPMHLIHGRGQYLFDKNGKNIWMLLIIFSMLVTATLESRKVHISTKKAKYQQKIFR